jgi:hypothetical protein
MNIVEYFKTRRQAKLDAKDIYDKTLAMAHVEGSRYDGVEGSVWAAITDDVIERKNDIRKTLEDMEPDYRSAVMKSIIKYADREARVSKLDNTLASYSDEEQDYAKRVLDDMYFDSVANDKIDPENLR